MGDLARGLDALMKSKAGYVLAENYRLGKVGEVFITSELEKMVDSVGDSFRVNFAAAPIEKLVRRTKLNVVTVEGDKRASRELQRIWDENELDREFRLAIDKCAQFGDAYVLAWPSKDGKSVRAFYNSPLAVRAIYDDENPRLIRFVVKLWKAGKKYRVNLYYADRVERYVTKEKINAKSEELCYNADQYEEFLDDDNEETDIPIDWGFIPVWHLKHGGDQYGEPAHLKAYGPQDAITKIVVTQMSSFDSVGFPARYGLSDPEATVDGMGEDFDDDNLSGFDDDSVADRRRKTKLKTAPGTMTLFDGLKEVGQFDAADPDSFIKPAEFYIKTLSILTDTPLEEVYPSGTPPTGESRRRAHEGINNHAETFRGDLTRPIEAFAEGMLAIAGIRAKGSAKVKVSWAPVDTVTDKDGWEVVAAKIAAGVPVRVALTEAGYEEPEIAEWFPDDLPAYTPTGLALLATTLQSFGQAKTLGAIDDATIVELLPELFAAARLEGESPFVRPSEVDVVEDPFEA